MAGSLGTLAIELAANTGRLTSDMGKAASVVERGVGRMSTSFRVFAGGTIVAGLTAMATRSIQVGDELQKAAVKAGVGGRAISELAYAASKSDVGLASLSTALRRMQTALSEAGTGAKGTNEALASLGLTLRELSALQPDKQFEVLGDRINSLQNPADRARIATELFGRAGADLLPLFEQGAQGIRSAREEAQRLGKSFTDETLRKMADADESIKKLKASFSAMATALTAEVAPSLTKFFNQIGAIASGDRMGLLKSQIDFLEQMQGRSFLSLGAFDDVEAGFYSAARGAEKLLELRTKLARLEGGRRGGDRGQGVLPAAPGPKDALQEEQELTEYIVTASKIRSDAMAEFYDSLDARTMTSTERQLSQFNEIHAALELQREAGKISAETFSERWNAALAELNAGLYDSIPKITVEIDQVSDYARDAAMRARNDFKTFFLDPSTKGLKGLAQSFLDNMRDVLAQGLVDQLFRGRSEGGAGLGGLLESGFGKLLGFANGGSFTVGGSGSTDSQLVAFRATPGERVAVTRPGQSTGGGAVHVHNHIDARGATTDLVKALPQILDASNRRAVEIAKAEMYADLDRIGYLRS